MSRHTTYSFLDLAGAISHPFFTQAPVYLFTGEGVGSVTVSMQQEKTAHDIAADGVVMVSKIAGENGQIRIECQQTSPLHKYLLGLYNFVMTESTDKWAMMTVVLRNIHDGTSHVAQGVSFGKIPDKAYAASGAKIAWVLWAAEIQNLTA